MSEAVMGAGGLGASDGADLGDKLGVGHEQVNSVWIHVTGRTLGVAHTLV